MYTSCYVTQPTGTTTHHDTADRGVEEQPRRLCSQHVFSRPRTRCLQSLHRSTLQQPSPLIPSFARIDLMCALLLPPTFGTINGFWLHRGKQECRNAKVEDLHSYRWSVETWNVIKCLPTLLASSFAGTYFSFSRKFGGKYPSLIWQSPCDPRNRKNGFNGIDNGAVDVVGKRWHWLCSI